MTSPTLLLVTGSTRAASTNTAALRAARAALPPDTLGVLYDGLAQLPAFNPDLDSDPLPPSVHDLRRECSTAAALLFCTPEYAGTLPGSFKNLLDWLVGGDGIQGKPVAWINVSSVAAPTGGAGAHESLATVLRYVDAHVVGTACARVPMTRADVDARGEVVNDVVRERIGEAVAELMAATRLPR